MIIVNERLVTQRTNVTEKSFLFFSKKRFFLFLVHGFLNLHPEEETRTSRFEFVPHAVFTNNSKSTRTVKERDFTVQSYLIFPCF